MSKALQAIEFRLNELKKAYSLVSSKMTLSDWTKSDYEARIDELETLLDYLSKDKSDSQ